MNFSKVFLLMILSLSLFFTTSCSDDGDDPSTDGVMTAKIDGTDWSSSMGLVAIHNGTTFTANGSDNSGRQLQVIVTNVTGTGTYAITNAITETSSARWTAGLNPTADMYLTTAGTGSGTVTITKLDGTDTEGTFSFTAANLSGGSVSVTEGEFSGALQP